MPELPEVQAHAERLADELTGRVLVRIRADQVHGTANGGSGARPGLRPAAARGRPSRQVPPARVRVRAVRRAPDAGRAAARRHQAVGQAARRSGPFRVRRGPGAAAHRGRYRAPSRRLVPARRVGPDRPHRSRCSARRPTRCRRTKWSSCSRPRTSGSTDSSAISARSPAWDGGWRTRSATGPRLSPFAMTRKARRRRRDQAGRRHPTVNRRRAGVRADSARHELVQGSTRRCARAHR